MTIARRTVTVLFAAAGVGGALLGGPIRAQDNQSAPSWVMQGCKALLANPSIAGQPGGAAANARDDSNRVQAQACLQSAQSILTVGSLGGAFCPPNAATALDAVGIIVRYIDARPGSEPGTFRDLANQALAKQWPC